MNIEVKRQTELNYKIIRFVLYGVLAVLSYLIMATVKTSAPIPSLLTACAVCVSVKEDPFDSAVFGALCGLLSDNAYQMISGLSALFLMWICLMISLIVRNVLRGSFFNFLIADIIAIFIMSGMRYLVMYGIDPSLPRALIFGRVIIPEMVLTNIAGVILFIIIGFISSHLGSVREHYIEEKSDNIVRE